jgi:hypothetical protein
MEQWLIMLIIFMVFYWVSIIALIFIFFRKKLKFYFMLKTKREKLVRSIFLMPSGTLLDDIYTTFDNNNMITFKEGSYNVVKELGFFSTTHNILTLIYTFKNPSPIDFYSLDNRNIPQYDSISIQKALQEKFIQDILKEQNKMALLVIMSGVNIAMSFVIILYELGLIQTGQ